MTKRRRYRIPHPGVASAAIRRYVRGAVAEAVQKQRWTFDRSVDTMAPPWWGRCLIGAESLLVRYVARPVLRPVFPFLWLAPSYAFIHARADGDHIFAILHDARSARRLMAEIVRVTAGRQAACYPLRDFTPIPFGFAKTT